MDVCTRSAILFSFQLLIILIIVCSSIYFIAQDSNKDNTLWITLLCSSVGYILPNPVLKKGKPL
jgi:hypothetical protein